MIVGLIRSEAVPDLRTPTATGATSTTRRTLAAVTAAALAALGVTLAISTAFTVLTVGYLDERTRVPMADFLVLAVGTPAAAALGGWVLAGGEPPTLSRQAIA